MTDRLAALQSRFHNYSLDKKAIPMAMVQSGIQYMEARGFTAEQSLAGTNIDLEAEWVTYRQRIRQLENMLELAGADGHWLESVREPSVSDYGLLGYAMMSSATLEEAVQIAVKYHRMAGAMFELTFLIDGEEAVLRIEHLLPSGKVGQFTVEDFLVGITGLIGLLLGRAHQPTRILLNYERPDYADRQEARFDCRVEFEQPCCEYRFDVNELREPLATADANTAKVCEASCRKLLNQMEIEEDIISRVCHLLLSTPGEFPKLDAVAQKLSLGARTLRRRLNELGTSYQNILDDVRRELAIEYLRTTNLTLQEVAELLGYSEVTNFRRAFMRWVELSPYQYRKQMMAPA